MSIAIITGASKGIGRATAQLLVSSGWRVINLARRSCSVEGVENVAIDLSSAQVETEFKKILSEKIPAPARIALIHNAARLENDRAQSTSTEQLRQVLQINLVAPHILNQHVIPLMSAGSSIIYIGSTLSEKAVPNTYSYVTSKHGLVGMMRATCQDLAGLNIHTCCVSPGFTDTEMLRDHVGNDEETLKATAALTTFNRLIAPEEIASTINFAIENPVINGAVLHANLGQVES